MRRGVFLASLVAVVLGLSLLMAVRAQGEAYGERIQFHGTMTPQFDLEGGEVSATLGGKLIFAGTDGNGYELWISNGVSTHRLKDLRPGTGESFPHDFQRFGSKVYFAANGGAGTELWVTDGTAAGTRQLRDLRPGPDGSNPRYFTVAGDRMYFSADDGSNGTELWVTNGAVVRLAADIWDGPTGSFPFNLTAYGSKLVFTAQPAAESFKPYVSDGTQATTKRLDALQLGTSVNPHSFVVLGKKILFNATGGTSGAELWHSSGVEGDARILKDIWSGNTGSDPRELTVLGSNVIFTATEPTKGRELWISNGTEQDTRLLKDLDDTESSDPVGFFRLGTELYFTATSEGPERELWATRGTTASTRMTADLRPGAGLSSTPFVLGSTGDRLLLTAYSENEGVELYRSNGTSAKLVQDVRPGVLDSSPNLIGKIDGTYFLSFHTGAETFRLGSYTLPIPTIKASPSASYSRGDAARRQIVVPVRVTASGVTPTGRVALFEGTRQVGVATLAHGVARVRITAALGVGSHSLRVRYGGSLKAQSRSSASFVVRVR